MKKLLLIIGSLMTASVSYSATVPFNIGGTNPYMVENTTGTDPSGNPCYYFQTSPVCLATITGLSSGGGSGTVSLAPQFQLPYYSGTTSSNVIAGLPGTNVNPTSGITITTPQVTITSMTAVSMTLAGSGLFSFTQIGNTWVVVGSSINIPTGHFLIATSSWTIGDGGTSTGGTPGTPLSSLQWNSAGTFAGLINTVVTVSSLSFTPGFGVQFDTLTLQTQGGAGGELFIRNSGGSNTAIEFDGDTGANEANIQTLDGTYWRFDLHNNNQFRILTASSEHFRIDATGDGNTSIGGGGFTSAVGFAQLQIAGPTDDKYSLVVGTATTSNYEVYVSTQGMLGHFPQTLAQIKATFPTNAGEDVYCSNCATDTICVSTGTGQGAYARASLRTTACQ